MILITGGIKSGKSSFALSLAKKFNKKAFVATGEPFDEEMRLRIARHKLERGSEFDTFEEPIKIYDVIQQIKDNYDVILVDCMTTWLGNIFHYNKDPEQEMEKLLASVSGKEIIVTNEVGFGLIPVDKTARLYTEKLGQLNLKLAHRAQEVFLVVSGIPIKIK
ncbi:adenosylcobinamide kinase/adenosylcobinamide-phosphate guanylyltransferase [Caldicoprobacter guelmensis]|uniref:bifunctional adenosylcobinamide kinase/adenosylcobinamide-phosphate guanylyltransferase n=1 Tax=Caldicoprobacter guelmensis TaxID=1170224 RepID=UPI0019567554|nr:bifunctional adenosylcobinamide kinase/adenosylcobinamide-phosphate guanylyltransferase [Caldicoprobacter guelmensis]MBM7581615.1 adenosylcobinamide kinase/adenosylcobinamide-phosphate guanylyltransferase [Caldicoprobacter guelmensis]